MHRVNIVPPRRRATIAAIALAVLAASSVAIAQEITLRWGDVVPATHPSVQMIDRIAAEVKAKSGGRIAIQSFPAGQLGSSRDMIEAVANGTQQVVTEGAANFGAWVPSISVVESPYIWRDADHLVKAMAGPVGKAFNDELVAKRGMRILGTTYYGTRQLTTSSKPVKTPADLVGFKLRVPENDVFKAMAEAWGAKPTPMNFGELYLALKQGAIDGQENPLPTIKSGKFDEVQKYLVLTAHIITPRIVVVNEAFWKTLKPCRPEDHRGRRRRGHPLAERRVDQAGEGARRDVQGRGHDRADGRHRSLRKAGGRCRRAQVREQVGQRHVRKTA
jgi:tripartite ATP-independent transporter DctP family solute receptor